MRLPGAEHADVEPAEVRDYLLSRSHPVGRFKARCCFGLGYSEAGWETLAADLKLHAEQDQVVEGESSAYGQKFEVRGTLTAPTGRGAEIIAVWIVRTGESIPRIVTAFPS